MLQQEESYRNNDQALLKPEHKYLLGQRSSMSQQTLTLSQHEELKIIEKFVAIKYSYVTT